MGSVAQEGEGKVARVEHLDGVQAVARPSTDVVAPVVAAYQVVRRLVDGGDVHSHGGPGRSIEAVAGVPAGRIS